MEGLVFILDDVIEELFVFLRYNGDRNGSNPATVICGDTFYRAIVDKIDILQPGLITREDHEKSSIFIKGVLGMSAMFIHNPCFDKHLNYVPFQNLRSMCPIAIGGNGTFKDFYSHYYSQIPTVTYPSCDTDGKELAS